MLDAPDPQDEPQSIGPYTTVRELGRGGQGVVYLAEDTRLHRKVALKVLTYLGPGSEDTVKRFKREAEVASRLEHPGICAVHDAGIADGVPFIAMQYLEGETLAHRISQARSDSEGDEGDEDSWMLFSRSLGSDPDPDTELDAPSRSTTTSASSVSRREIENMLRMFEKIARALHAAHEVGIIHRDIKPANIMVTADGPVILDFGLARAEDPELQTLTRTGDLFGTPAYMSPEQLTRGDLRLDRRTDVYSLAASLYECLSLERPFSAPTRESLYQAITTREATDIRKLNPLAPPELAVVIETAMEKDRDRRYQSALEFAEELRRIREYRPINAKAIGRLLRMRRWAQRNPAAASAVGSLIVGFVVAIFLWLAAAQARDEAEAQRRVAETQRNRADMHLQEYERLADEFRLQQLIDEAREDLWPALPSKAESMRAWVARAEQLVSNLPVLRTALTDLRSAALPRSDVARAKDRSSHTKELSELLALETEARGLRTQAEQLEADGSRRAERRLESVQERLDEIEEAKEALEATLDTQLTWEFVRPTDRWRHDRLTVFIKDLEAFAAKDGSGDTLESVRERLAFADTIERRSLHDAADAWRNAIREIRTNPVYAGMATLEPQLGLVPLGQDAESGLWEFAHLQTGEAPVRDPSTNKLVLTDQTGLVFVLVPGGSFTMGAQSDDPSAPNHDPQAQSNEAPPHEVALDPFFLSKYEMTQGQWMKFTGENPSQYNHTFRTNIPRNPIENVTWNECVAVLRKLDLLLPTEAQWERACRAGTDTPWSTGKNRDSLKGFVNVAERAALDVGAPWDDAKLWPDFNDGHIVHAPVGSFRPNPFGFHDMHGNVFEWCRDWYASYDRPARPSDGLRGDRETKIRNRILRSGSFSYAARDARSAYRFGGAPELRYYTNGLRPARRID